MNMKKDEDGKIVCSGCERPLKITPSMNLTYRCHYCGRKLKCKEETLLKEH